MGAIQAQPLVESRSGPTDQEVLVERFMKIQRLTLQIEELKRENIELKARLDAELKKASASG